MLNDRKMLIVGGNFAEDVRPSGFVKALHKDILEAVDKTCIVDIKNGGTYEDLQLLVDSICSYNIILWFANVPNTYDKVVSDIKIKNPTSILINSKNNLDNKYGYHEIASRMLNVKANLCMVFTKKFNTIETTIMDPLMNGFTNKDPDIKSVVKVLINRISELLSYTRAPSIKDGDAIEADNEEEFFKIAHNRADIFHELIHAHDTSRFLGNLSFRCERGFPSYRNGDIAFVSRRNIDKRAIGKDGFVAVSLKQKPGGGISYFGEAKPSVDTPIQIALYNLYPNIKYMMHGHVYIKGAPFTVEKIPCGAMEEVDAIIKVIPSNIEKASINLFGHGSIVMTNDLSYFNEVEYEARPVLEY